MIFSASRMLAWLALASALASSGPIARNAALLARHRSRGIRPRSSVMGSTGRRVSEHLLDHGQASCQRESPASRSSRSLRSCPDPERALSIRSSISETDDPAVQ